MLLTKKTQNLKHDKVNKWMSDLKKKLGLFSKN